MSEYSDYIVYVDESGDHSLQNINANYPVFVLAFCIFDKKNYAKDAVPSLIQLKFEYFGHDMTILHERDIRKQKGSFAVLRQRNIRKNFITDLSDFVEGCDFTLLTVVIKKNDLVGQYTTPENPYELAMKFGLERLYAFLQDKGQEMKETVVVFEKRGKSEDRDLELEFRRVCDGANYHNIKYSFSIEMASKKCNSCGLQLADLTARPIGQFCLHPEKENRAYDVLEPKLYQKYGKIDGWGVKIFPK